MGMSPDIRAQKVSKVLQSFVSTKSHMLLDGIKAQNPHENTNPLKTSIISPLKTRKKMKRANSEQVVVFKSAHQQPYQTERKDQQLLENTSLSSKKHLNCGEKLPAIHKAEILTSKIIQS